MIIIRHEPTKDQTSHLATLQKTLGLKWTVSEEELPSDTNVILLEDKKIPSIHEIALLAISKGIINQKIAQYLLSVIIKDSPDDARKAVIKAKKLILHSVGETTKVSSEMKRLHKELGINDNSNS
jgi:hypothetical protein